MCNQLLVVGFAGQLGQLIRTFWTNPTSICIFIVNISLPNLSIHIGPISVNYKHLEYLFNIIGSITIWNTSCVMGSNYYSTYWAILFSIGPFLISTISTHIRYIYCSISLIKAVLISVSYVRFIILALVPLVPVAPTLALLLLSTILRANSIYLSIE